MKTEVGTGMTLLTIDRLWLRSLKWVAIISIPMCSLMVIDSSTAPDGNFLPPQVYALGTVIYVVHSYIKGYDDGELDVMTAWSCVANSAVIWLFAYIILRLRRRRKALLPPERSG